MDDKRRFTLHCPTCRSRIVVDAETGRHLKVDRLYPELGLALRFKGALSAPGAAELDEIELIEEDTRDEIRARLCRQAGIALVGSGQ